MLDKYSKAMTEMERVVDEYAQRAAEAFKDKYLQRIGVETNPELSESLYGSSVMEACQQAIDRIDATYASRMALLHTECWETIGQVDLKYRIFL